MGQSWIKAHDSSKNTFWENYPSIASPIIDTELNRNEVSVDTVDDRVITLDTTKAEQSDLLQAFKDVSLDSTTGVITFTLFNNTTKTIDTLLEKIAINFDYDDNPSSPHYQNLVIELEDGTYKYIDMSALITQYEFTNSSCISWTIGNDGSVSANVIDGSITESKLQPNFLADCRSAKQGAENAEADAIAKALVSEGYANGKQNGVPVTSESPYYHNNAEYFKDQAQSIVGSKVDSFNGRTGVVTSQTGDYNQSQISVPTGATEGQVPIVRSGVFAMELPPTGVTVPQALDFIGKKTHFDSDISCVADIYESKTEFNANGSITERLRYNGKNLLENKGNTTTSSNVTFKVNSDGSVTVSGTNSTSGWVSLSIGGVDVTNLTSVVVNSNATATLSGTSVKARADFYNSTGTYISGSDVLNSDVSLNVPSGAKNLIYMVYVYTGYAISTPITIYPMIRLSGASATFEPYYNNVKTTHFMGNDIIEDLHDYQGCVDLGSLNWTYSSQYALFFTEDLTGKCGRNATQHIACKEYTTTQLSTTATNEQWRDESNNTIGLKITSTIVALYIKNSSYTDANTFKSAMSGVYATYETSTQ